MSKTEKQLEKVKHNPRDWGIDDLKEMADRFGVSYRQPGTSHVTFRSKIGEKLTVPAHKPIKAIYVKVVELIEALGENI